MHHRPSVSEPEATSSPTIQVTAVPRRALLGVVMMVVLTVGSLGLAWFYPDATSFHFLWVTQAVPVLYLLLAWWGTQSTRPRNDAS